MARSKFSEETKRRFVQQPEQHLGLQVRSNILGAVSGCRQVTQEGYLRPRSFKV